MYSDHYLLLKTQACDLRWLKLSLCRKIEELKFARVKLEAILVEVGEAN